MRKFCLMAIMAILTCMLFGCAAQNSSSSSTQAADINSVDISADVQDKGSTSNAANETAQQEASSSSDAAASSQAAVSPAAMGTVPNTLAQDEEALVATYASQFQQIDYYDEATGLSVTYNLFLPKDYDESASYPMVVFIGDSSCAGGDATRSLTQGLGALVWASDEWQAANPTIVCVPTYPETILDDHGSYTTTEYVELTKRLIETVSVDYAVDANRIYGTGQSMGCMTTLVLASQYPDLYAACMFVDGQWDITTLAGLEGQRFVYFAAEDDTNASAGMAEVMDMFAADGVEYAHAQWDGNASPDELSAAAQELFANGTAANFVSWATGTIDASSASMGGMMGGSGGPSGEGGFGGPSGEGPSGEGPSGEFGGPDGASGSGPDGEGGGMGSVAYHMASFDYAYNCIAAMEWLFQQA